MATVPVERCPFRQAHLQVRPLICQTAVFSKQEIGDGELVKPLVDLMTERIRGSKVIQNPTLAVERTR